MNKTLLPFIYCYKGTFMIKTIKEKTISIKIIFKLDTFNFKIIKLDLDTNEFNHKEINIITEKTIDKLINKYKA